MSKKKIKKWAEDLNRIFFQRRHTDGQRACEKILNNANYFSLVQSLSRVSLRPHESHHARPPCPSPTPRVYPNLIIREMQIKAAMRYYHTYVRIAVIQNLQRTDAGEEVEKRELLYTVGGNVSQCSHYGKQFGGSSKKKKKETRTSK